MQLETDLHEYMCIPITWMVKRNMFLCTKPLWRLGVKYLVIIFLTSKTLTLIWCLGVKYPVIIFMTSKTLKLIEDWVLYYIW